MPRFRQAYVLVAQLAFQKYKTNFILQKNAKDNFYRKLAQVLDLQFIYRETAHYYGTEGQESIDPVIFVFSAKQQFNALNSAILSPRNFLKFLVFEFLS